MSLSSIAAQVIWNRLIAVTEEQASTLVRTAFSPSVREAGDLSAGVYDAHGRMMAQAVTGTPGHVNSMAESVGHFIRRIGRQNVLDGDIYITNNPWEGTGHLHDITVVTPVFRDRLLTGFFACTAHVVDIGGRGFGADAASVFEEGLHIPIMKFAERGVADPTLLGVIRANVRQPDQLIGDIFALAACNDIGMRRLHATMDEYALTTLDEIAAYIFDHSRRATIGRIRTLPRKEARGHMRIDGFDTPIDLHVRLQPRGDRILCDFAGTSRMDRKGINVPMVYTRAYACYALKCAIAPDIPNNAASLEPFVVSAPEGSILNAGHPAPVALRHVIGHLVPDTVFDALHQLLPDQLPAEGAGSLCNFHLSLRPRRDDGPVPDDPESAEVLMFNSGGSGARPGLDGMNATAFPSGVMTMPVEVIEHTGPVIIWRKELRPDSGGAGRQRGGLGQNMEIGARDGHEFDISCMFDRVRFPARGRNGGGSGGATTITRSDGGKMRGKGKQFVPHGARVELGLPGGAGYGPPTERARQAVANDLVLEYISPGSAIAEYGMTEAEVGHILASAHRRGLPS